MTLKTDVESGVAEVLYPAWSKTKSETVPETTDIVLRNGAVMLDATYVYADMADSTGLAQKHTQDCTAKVIRSYLNAATRILRYHGGQIRSFDGDRVMAIFVGNRKNTNAVIAALQITWAVKDVIDPKVKAKWTDVTWTMSHGVGIDTGEAMLVRGGVRGDNDVVSIGNAPNVAAKLSEWRSYQELHITKAVYDVMLDEAKIGSNGGNMWTDTGWKTYGGLMYQTYGSSWQWAPG
jgi:adenylate cyclase